MSFIYENSCKDKPKFILDDITSKLYRLEGKSRKEVLYESKAREVIQNIHRPPGRACRKGVGRVQIPVLLQRNGWDCSSNPKGVQWNLQQVKSFKNRKSTSKSDPDML